MSTLYRAYDPAVLKRLQRVQLAMLDDFIALCEKHGIRWWIDFGSAIGALRHGGMVPWDDDIDIGMLREDFEKFLEVSEAEMGDKYYVLDAKRFPEYPLMTARWCLRGTKFREECMAGVDAPFGIFLDLYCYECLADDPKAARRQWWHAWFWGKLMVLRGVGSPVLYFGGIRAALTQAVCRTVHWALRLLVRPETLYRKALGWARKYKGEETERVFYSFSPTPFLDSIRVDEIFPTVEAPFDGRTVRLQRGADAFLRQGYGDYMTPPPPEGRHNHPPLELDFGGYGGDAGASR